MAKILFWPDIYREQGHWYPNIALAQSLDALDVHDIEFMGIGDCASIVQPYPFLYRPIFEDIYPIGHSVEDNLEPKGQRWKPHHLLPITRGQGGLDEIFIPAVGIPPELLISGYFTSLETLVLHHKYGVNFMINTTYLRHPDMDPESFVKTKLVYMSKPMRKKILDLAITDDIPEPTIDDFVAPLQRIEEIIPCPAEFDYVHYKHGDRVSYVEPMIHTPPPPPPDPESDPLRYIPSDKKIIFGTSGSQVEDYLFKAREFFDSMIDMMSLPGMEDYYLVLSVGARLYEDYKEVKESGVAIFSWVSQVDILTNATAAFCHGGLATIKESIVENVPIIIVPHGKDQMDNALRVVDHNLGVISNAHQLSPQNLKKALVETTSSVWIKKDLKKMSELFNQREAEKPSLAIIDSVLP